MKILNIKKTKVSALYFKYIRLNLLLNGKIKTI